MEPIKPRTVDELPLPFLNIGEPGWVNRTHDVLTSFGVPLPEPVRLEELAECERRLGLELPTSCRRFLLELGPLDIDEFRFLPPREILPMSGFYAADLFDPGSRRRLQELVSVAEYCGTDDPFAIDQRSCEVCRVGHDPPGLSLTMPSFDVLVRCALLGLACGYYGFPDASVQSLVEQARFALTGHRM